MCERAGLLLVVVGLSASVAAPFLPWQSDFDVFGIGGSSAVVVLGLGPLVSGWLVAARLPRRFFAEERGYGRFGRSWWAIAAAGLQGAGAVTASADIDPLVRGPGGPLLAAGAVALVVGWLGLAAGRCRPLMGRADPEMAVAAAGNHRWTWLWAALAAAVPVAVAAVVVAQVSVLRLVDHSTAPALPPLHLGDSAAIRLGTVDIRWRVRTSLASERGVLAAGRYVVVASNQGVTVREVVGGRQRWHYWRSDAVFDGAAVTPDGRFLIVVMQRYGDPPTGTQSGLMAGFDLATGQERWRRSVATYDSPVPLSAAGDTVAVYPAGNCGFLGRTNSAVEPDGCRDVVGYAAATGALRWRWHVGACRPVGPVGGEAAVAAQIGVLAGDVCNDSSVAVVPGATGRPVQWRPRQGSLLAAGVQGVPEMLIAAVPKGFLVPFLERRHAGAVGALGIARLGPDGTLLGPPLSAGCPPPFFHATDGSVSQSGDVQQAGQVLACASAQRDAHGSMYVDMRGVSVASGHVLWRRRISFASEPVLAAVGDAFYVSARSRGRWETMAIRAGNGVSLGQVPGYEAAASGGAIIILQPSGGQAIVTAYGGR